MADLMKDWDERYQKAQSLFASFKEKYEKIPGVMLISDDDWFGDTFIVYIDTQRYVQGSIPKDFDGILVQGFNTRETLKSYQETMEMIKKQAPPETNLNTSPFDFFTRNIARLTKMIEEYEKNNEQPR